MDGSREIIRVINVATDVLQSEGCLIISVLGEYIGIGVSDTENGDAELFTTVPVCKEILSALGEALDAASDNATR